MASELKVRGAIKFCSRACYMAARKKTDAERIAIVRAKRRRWYAENAAKVRAYATARRHRQGGKIKVEDVRFVLSASGGNCVYCGNPHGSLQVDHVEPVAMGGKSERSNYIPACVSCNSSKGKKEVADWLYAKHGVGGLARAVFFLEQGRLPKELVEATQAAILGIEIQEVA